MRTAGGPVRERRWKDMILETFVTSTVLIIGIFCLRKLTFGKISMRLRYGLWLLVVVRLLVPLSVGTSAFSVMNLLPGTFSENAGTPTLEGENGGNPSADAGRVTTPAGGREEVFSGGRHAGAEQTAGQKSGETGNSTNAEGNAAFGRTAPEKEGAAPGLRDISLSGLLGAVWLLGFLAAGGYMVIAEWRFIRFLLRNRKAFPVEAVPQEFAERFSRRRIKVYQVKGLPGPCLAGRHIYIGEGAAAQGQNLTHILAHEYCHALHGDGLWAFLRCALAAVYWFDPFVWAAAYAARQDSELACDEAAVKLLGESRRFDYGRTLLALLECGAGKEKCPGMTFMTEGGGRSVRERITALAEKSRRRRTVLTAVLVAAAFICGCTFTGAELKAGNPAGETGEQETADTGGTGQDDTNAAAVSDARNRLTVMEEDNGEFARIQKEYEEAVGSAKLTEEQIRELEESALQEADRAAFQDMLDYYSAMEAKGSREFDIQSYYDWQEGKGGEKPEDGWYLLGSEEGGLIYFYGLYTEDFGFRGLKVRIGQDETNLDIPWCASYLNGISENIRILEYAENGWPRRFVWKLLAQESSKTEIWRLYSAYRYDTGTIVLRTLTEEECLEWANANLRFDIDRDAAKVYVTYDGDMVLGDVDISAYAGWETESVEIVPDAVAFTLDDRAGKGAAFAGEEGLAVYLFAGLKLEGVEGLWFDGLPLLTVQVVEDENSDSGFRLQSPRIDEYYEANAIWQERELEALKNGTGKEQD
ncbi:MAG: M56 family metallopeptidase [Lachnospiraceae bacterium]|nr:M56 family metallopeptidase [Lachnospiraceae bacterium]